MVVSPILMGLKSTALVLQENGSNQTGLSQNGYGLQIAIAWRQYHVLEWATTP